MTRYTIKINLSDVIKYYDNNKHFFNCYLIEFIKEHFNKIQFVYYYTDNSVLDKFKLHCNILEQNIPYIIDLHDTSVLYLLKNNQEQNVFHKQKFSSIYNDEHSFISSFITALSFVKAVINKDTNENRNNRKYTFRKTK